MWLWPTKKTTPAEYAVLVVSSALALVVLGIAVLVKASRVADDKHDVAVGLAHYGFWCIGIGAAIGLAYWAYLQVRDY